MWDSLRSNQNDLIYCGKIVSLYIIRTINWIAHEVASRIWVLTSDIISLCLSVFCILFIVLLISLFKSLKPRYNFCESKECQSNVDIDENRRSDVTSSRLDIPAFVFSIRKRFVDDSCRLAMSNLDIQSVYRSMSWAQTHVDLEGVSWINKTLLTFWPPIRTLINGFLLQIKARHHPSESKQLAKRQTKLALYLSCRRKLDALRQARQAADRDDLSRLGLTARRGIVRILAFFLKLLSIYTKQFINDIVVSLASKGRSDSASENKIMKELIPSKFELIENATERISGPRSWSGSDYVLCKAPKKSSKRKLRSALASLGPKKFFVMTKGLTGPNAQMKFLRNRLKLADSFSKAHRNLTSNEVSVERIKLGNTIPKINGLKLIESDNELLNGLGRVLPYKLINDDSSIKLMCEMSFNSDSKFLIRVSSLPILGRIDLTKVEFQIRFLLTVNHTTTELNKDLKIFQTPDDALFPVINYVHLTLLDVPRFNWNLERAQTADSSKSPKQDQKQTPARSLCKSSPLRLRNYLDPICIINSNLFKYLVHLTLCFILRWFRPFDIKIGERLYCRSII